MSDLRRGAEDLLIPLVNLIMVERIASSAVVLVGAIFEVLEA
jgi:hypothetical protein